MWYFSAFDGRSRCVLMHRMIGMVLPHSILSVLGLLKIPYFLLQLIVNLFHINLNKSTCMLALLPGLLTNSDQWPVGLGQFMTAPALCAG